MTVVVLLSVAIVLVMVLLWIELMEFAVLFLAAIIIMVSTAVWLELVPIFTIFTALGLGILAVVALLVYKAMRSGPAPLPRAPHEMGNKKPNDV